MLLLPVFGAVVAGASAAYIRDASFTTVTVAVGFVFMVSVVGIAVLRRAETGPTPSPGDAPRTVRRSLLVGSISIGLFEAALALALWVADSTSTALALGVIALVTLASAFVLGRVLRT